MLSGRLRETILDVTRRPIDFEPLSLDQRLDLIEDLWESLDQSELDTLELTAPQRDELDRRLDLLNQNGPSGISPEQLRAKIEGPGS